MIKQWKRWPHALAAYGFLSKYMQFTKARSLHFTFKQGKGHGQRFDQTHF